MTTELILLMALFTFILMGSLTKTPRDAFNDSAPRLAARVETQLSTGAGFINGATGAGYQWDE